MLDDEKGRSPAKLIAYSAVTAALLICVQLALSAVPGVECVTVILLCTSFVFGARFGAITGLAFSLLRCILFGAYLTAIILYCIYFPLFGILFGLIGRSKKIYSVKPACIFLNAAFILAALAAAFAAGFSLIRVSRLNAGFVNALLWSVFAIFLLCAAVLDILAAVNKNSRQRVVALFIIVFLSASCTILFTLLDDVITPLVLGMSASAALGYFYASFTAMLPQTICTIVTVSLLFYPLTDAFRRIK